MTAEANLAPATHAGLVVITVIMGLGVVSVFARVWRPLIGSL